LSTASDGHLGRYTYRRCGIDRLTGIVDALAVSVVAHDSQIESLITVAEQQGGRIQALITAAEKHERAIEDMHKQWQAYLNTLPRH
jgi:hypothetical protein